MVAAKRADFDAIAAKFHIDKVLARIIRNRDVIDDPEIDRFLNGTLSDINDAYLMKDIRKAADILRERIKEGKRIRIIGDYDVDGICSTYILLRGLRAAGAVVDTVIPNRITDGYGLNDNLIRNAKNDGIDLILTCDNGIAAREQTELASSLGIEVIVTDHHEVPFDIVDGKRSYILPEALAVVDPKQEDCAYPFEGICGAVIAWKLVGILLKEATSLMTELLSFAALATVCDVMELRDENRIIVKYGLKEMTNTVNKGLKALITATGLEDRELTCYHLGFVLGPCLNATGRLDTAQRALLLFDSEEYSDAAVLANSLRELNDSRKKMTEDGAKEAIDMVLNSPLLNDRVLVIFLPQCHESLAGIIAGRVKEYFNRPSFVITRAEDGVKGSGRSIEAYDMYAELSRVKELFTKFGGHKMAAGLSLPDEAGVDELRRRLNENCTLSDDDLMRVVHIDVPMPLSYVTLSFTESLSLLEPFGTGNPKPLFADRNVSLVSYVRLGKNKNVGKLKAIDDKGGRHELIYFEPLDILEEYLSKKSGSEKLALLKAGGLKQGDMTVNIVYYPEINEYRGQRSVEIVLKYIS